MEFKTFNFECKADVSSRTITAYASTWQKDLVGDQIIQGAFKKTIDERHPKNEIKLMYQHRDILGPILDIYEDAKGLFIRGYISDTSYGNDVIQLVKDKALTQMSIGYDVLEDDLSADGKTRYLKQLRLYEASIVTFGANPTTSIESLKSIEALQMATMFKEGRTISNRNLDKIRAAVEHLTELLNAAGKDDEKNRPDYSTQKNSIVPEAFTDLEQVIGDMKAFLKR